MSHNGEKMQSDRYQIDGTFGREYECTVLDSVPRSGIATYAFPGGQINSQVVGLVLEVVPHSAGCEAWIGSFAVGDLSGNALSGVYSCPSAKHVLVVAKGEAYIVNVESPTEYQHLKLLPVMGIVQVRAAAVTVLYDFTRLEGYGVVGRCWQTPSLSWDGLRNVVADGRFVVGEGWDSPNGRWISFRVDAQDGSIVGGASPELLSARDRQR